MSKNFELAAAGAVGDEDEAPLPFTIADDETQLWAFRPTQGQMVLLLGAAGSSTSDDSERAGQILDVFWELLDEDTARHLRGRLASRHDSFGMQDILNIMQWLAEEAAARPTRPSLASLPSRATSGRTSTGGVQRVRSTRSRSAPVASTT
ncbi:MAG: hypothetical protein ABWZ30_05505 [Jiangellaceae bacterium]